MEESMFVLILFVDFDNNKKQLRELNKCLYRE